MQTIIYITLAYAIITLLTSIALTERYFNKNNTTGKHGFYRIILLSIVPVFNLFLLLGIIGVSIYEFFKNRISELWKK